LVVARKERSSGVAAFTRVGSGVGGNGSLFSIAVGVRVVPVANRVRISPVVSAWVVRAVAVIVIAGGVVVVEGRRSSTIRAVVPR